MNCIIGIQSATTVGFQHVLNDKLTVCHRDGGRSYIDLVSPVEKVEIARKVLIVSASVSGEPTSEVG